MKKKLFNNKGISGIGIVVAVLAVLLIIGFVFSNADLAEDTGQQKNSVLQDEDVEPIATHLTEAVSDESESDTEPSETTAKETGSSTTNTSTSKSTTDKTTAKKTTALQSTNGNGNLEITMLNVGQGLSILIKADDKYMLYDGGGRSSSSYVVAYLKNHGINKITTMFVSHYAEDHIAGLIGVLNTTEVEKVVCPDYVADTDIYRSFINKLKENGAKVIHPKVGDQFSLGNAGITVLNPPNYSSYTDNNTSIVARVTYGSFSCLLTGDIEYEGELNVLNSGYDVKSDLLVVAHHGSSTSTKDEFVKAVNPKYAFISCGKDNSYGHPTQETLDTLKNNKVEIFRSDLQGEVTCFVKKGKCSFSKNPYPTYAQQGLATTTRVTTTKQEEIVRYHNFDEPAVETYVLNTNTKKFHYPSCSSVNQMAEHNKQVVECDREELIAQGYSPCGRCHP